MTKDEALTMIIASIAMEELALSHIVNAEGEKLQYVLGTLPKGRTPCASPQEILAVNKSVKELLDTVMQSQMLLKGKLERALEAGGHEPGPMPPGPDGPCCPEGPPSAGGGSCCPEKPPCASGGSCCPEKPPCASGGSCCPEKPPCASNGLCRPKSAIQLVSRGSGFSWGNGTPMSWKCRGQKGCGIRWSEKTPALVSLDPEKTYALNFAINICGSFPGDSTGAVCVKLAPCNAFLDILPLHFFVKCLECRPWTLHYTATLFPQACPPPEANLSLILNYRDSLFVDQASLSIVEL